MWAAVAIVSPLHRHEGSSAQCSLNHLESMLVDLAVAVAQPVPPEFALTMVRLAALPLPPSLSAQASGNRGPPSWIL